MKTYFFEPDCKNAKALKKNQARKNNQPNHIFAVINKSPKDWTPKFHYEVVTGFCFLGRMSVNNQKILVKKLYKCAGSISIIEAEAANPFQVDEDYYAYGYGHYHDLFTKEGWIRGANHPDLADNPQQLQYKQLVYHRSKRMKDRIDIEGAR